MYLNKLWLCISASEIQHGCQSEEVLEMNTALITISAEQFKII